jgi:hypothetical protein
MLGEDIETTQTENTNHNQLNQFASGTVFYLMFVTRLNLGDNVFYQTDKKKT